jgi:hypothetical protein
MMWGTTSPSAKHTDDSGSAFEALLIGDSRLFRSLARNQPLRLLGLLQHYLPRSDIWLIAGTRGRIYPEVKAPGTCRSPVFTGGADSVGRRLRSQHSHFEHPRTVFREDARGIHETSSSKVFASGSGRYRPVFSLTLRLGAIIPDECRSGRSGGDGATSNVAKHRLARSRSRSL